MSAVGKVVKKDYRTEGVTVKRASDLRKGTVPEGKGLQKVSVRPRASDLHGTGTGAEGLDLGTDRTESAGTIDPSAHVENAQEGSDRQGQSQRTS